jgi:hypothetical protein
MTRAGSADFDPPKKTAPPGSADFELEKNAGFEVGVDGNANSGFEAGANRFANSGFAELSTVVFTKIAGSANFESKADTTGASCGVSRRDSCALT